ncbi:uncharacterized protein N7459_010108 [Penicillium hispanicum]|uniref:uncharacterized protein n=1 Tax=Penicillium hispanicum TaxID=1080232 RepID=UPI00253FC054|nr:uncharacterized protein N7459_010108 [Penicillium hispanicum]KAJ5566726.1 hypothetical protein N7459_010108 [Penicillium hispanicum]
MPPKRAKSSQTDPQLEGRVLLAIQAIQTNQIPSIYEAARTFSVPNSTLRRRLNGTLPRNLTRANSHKLTETEEITIYNWIISLDDRGAGPRPAMVREMANLLLAQRCSSTVGQKWVYNFIQRHPDIATRFTRRYDYQRAKNEDPRVIQAWFDLVQRTIETNGIAAEDIYNFDETGFAMGLVATTKVVTRAEYYGKRKILQPGNRE